MKILFYSTNSNHFDGNTFKINTLPSWKNQWEQLCNIYPEHEFIIITQLPGMFLLDLENNSVKESCSKIKYFVTRKDSPYEIAELIKSYEPDIAIAVSFWVNPYDWLPINDGIIAEILQTSGIKTICHPSKTALECFDKNKTHNFLSTKKYKVPNAVYVHHELYWGERNKLEVKNNVYKEYIHHNIKNLKFPVVIKDTVGLSSYGMEVASTYNQVISFLSSKRNNSDRIIEEYIEGLQFGTEIHGTNGKYIVHNPYLFSVNKYGITSPKQSVKIGPICDKKYKIKKLKQTLKHLAKDLNLSGIAQVDLVFSNNEWYIIEINTRISGMTPMYAISQNKTIYSILTEIALNKINKAKQTYTINFKLPILTETQMNELSKEPYIKYINQLHNLNAKQEREQGYCEIILGGTKTKKELIDCVNNFFEKYPNLIEPIFAENANKLIQILGWNK